MAFKQLGPDETDYTGTSENDAILGNDLDNILSGAEGSDYIRGAGGDDVISGDAGGDNLAGGAGKDAIYGNEGDDVIVLETATDLVAGETYDGGAGDDRFVVNGSFDGGGKRAFYDFTEVNLVSIREVALLTQGSMAAFNTAQLSGVTSLAINTVNLATGGAIGNFLNFDVRTLNLSDAGNSVDLSDTLVFNLTINGGAGNDVVIGGEASSEFEVGNVINGGGGADQLTGGSGIDIIDGGSGDDVLDGAGGDRDVLNYDSATRGVTISLALDGIAQVNRGAGTDIVRNFENLQGSSFNDRLTGNAGNNVIIGGGGADRMYGGLGNDTYSVSEVGDKAFEAKNEGVDTVNASVSYSLSGQYIENLNLSGDAADGTGNSLNNSINGNLADNVLTGGAGNDVLFGGGGDDMLIGGTGDDVYYVDGNTETESGIDRVIEDDNAGNDVVHSTGSFTLARTFVETLYLDGDGSISGIGNSLDNAILGNSGDNRLDGAGGNDQLYGFGGDDTYVVDSTGDVVVEEANGGDDTVEVSYSYTLLDNFENLTLIGEDAIDGTGNEADNFIFGNEAVNVLSGLGGNDFLFDGGERSGDTLIGGTGDDLYFVSSAGTVVTELKNEGTDDTVVAAVDFSLRGIYAENLVLFFDAVKGTGNSLNNSISGNDVNNQISGREGDDVLIGGFGNDVLTGGSGSDTFVFDTTPGAGNVDRITDFVSADDTIRLDLGVFGLTQVSPEAFQTGAVAQDADDRILYDAQTGNILFDADGNGAEEAILFARLVPGTELSAADFAVILQP